MSPDALRVRRALADPARLAALLGLDKGAKRTAAGAIVCCPAHNERHPSCAMRVGADGTVMARCFACGFTADAIGLVAVVRGLDVRRDFRAAYLAACELAGVEPGDRSTSGMGSDSRVARETLQPQRFEPAPSICRDSAPALDAARFDALARRILAAGNLDAPSSADVRAYLAARGLLDAARADGWAALPPLDALDVDRAELGASGLVLPSGEEWTHAAHRLAIPWRGLDGAIATIQRRRCDAATGERYALPAGRAPREPYGAEALARAPGDAPIVIVEGAADVLAARALARGPVVVLGLPGVGAWRASCAELARGRRVLVGLDNDAAGDRAADVLARDLAAAGASHVERVRPPHGCKDWCDVLAIRARNRAA